MADNPSQLVRPIIPLTVLVLFLAHHHSLPVQSNDILKKCVADLTDLSKAQASA